MVLCTTGNIPSRQQSVAFLKYPRSTYKPKRRLFTQCCASGAHCPLYSYTYMANGYKIGQIQRNMPSAMKILKLIVILLLTSETTVSFEKEIVVSLVNNNMFIDPLRRAKQDSYDQNYILQSSPTPQFVNDSMLGSLIESLNH